jgi:hypothetical protein
MFAQQCEAVHGDNVHACGKYTNVCSKGAMYFKLQAIHIARSRLQQLGKQVQNFHVDAAKSRSWFTQTTHTHNHTHTHAHTHARTYTQKQTQTQTHRHTDTQTHRHTDTQTHSLRQKQTDRHTHNHTFRSLEHVQRQLRDDAPLSHTQVNVQDMWQLG